MLGPIEWINAKLGEFLALPSKWEQWYTEAQQVFQAEAQARFARGVFVQGPAELAALELLAQIDQLRREWNGIRSKLNIERREQLGQVPVALIVTGVRIIAAAIIVIAITAVFRKSSALESVAREVRAAGGTPEDVLRAVELSANEKSALQSVVGGVSDVVRWLVIGGLAVAIVPTLMQKVKR